MYVIKRNGDKQAFDKERIYNAIIAAFYDVDGEITEYADLKAWNIADFIENYTEENGGEISVEKCQDLCEHGLMSTRRKDVAQSFIRYRYKRELMRQANTTDQSIKELLDGQSEFWNTENSNKNAKWVTTQRDYLAGITSKDIAKRFIFPKEVMEAHDKGIIHIHDLDYAAQNTLHNCCLINLEDMLQNGTVINGVTIDKPHRFITASTIASQIIAAVASSQYGGTSISLTHLAPFVKDSFNMYVKKYTDWGFEEKEAKKFALFDTKKEIADGIQTLNYQLNSLTTTNGQAPFVTIFMYLGETEEYKKELAMLIEETLNQRIMGMKNKVGVYVSPAFPKLIYCLEEDNISEDSPYWYLTELSAKCSAKRLVPDYISEKMMKELKLSKGEKPGEGDVYTCMGCRSFLTPDVSGNGFNNVAKAKNYDGKPKYYGRFNIGVSTVNLAYVAYEAAQTNNPIDNFWRLMDYYTELCHKAQRIRAERLMKTKAEVAPILWCDGALARLEPDETLEKLIVGQYCTSSLGYAGLYECVKKLTGQSHTSKEGKEFALKVMQYLNDQCTKWKEAENIGYSVYGTPIESTTYKFAKALKRDFDYDKDYITNSYHVHVTEEIDAFSKLAIESEFQKLSPGGAISYVETANLQNNIPAILEVLKFIYNNIMYAELNTKSDYCQICGYDGEIEIKLDPDTDKHYFECPNCGNRNQEKMNIARRVCGYISTNGFNEGRLEEIAERIVHLDDKPYEL